MCRRSPDYDEKALIDTGAAGPILASSLLMRGMTKGKLGDAAGKDKDVAAAQALDANIITRYRNFGILPR